MTSCPRESARPPPPRGACPQPSSAKGHGRRPGSPSRPAVRGRSGRLGPSQGAIGFLPDRQSAGEIVRFLTQARSEAVGEPAGAHAEDPARPHTRPDPAVRALPAPSGLGQRLGLITRNRSAGTRREAASERPRPCPLAGGPRQRPRGAPGSRPLSALRGKPAGPRAAAPPQPPSEVAPGAYLVILKNDFGWDFLANDFPEDRVATRPGGLSLSDLICHRGLPPARPSEKKLGRGEEGGAGGANRGRERAAKPTLGPLLAGPSCAARAHWQSELRMQRAHRSSR